MDGVDAVDSIDARALQYLFILNASPSIGEVDILVYI